MPAVEVLADLFPRRRLAAEVERFFALLLYSVDHLVEMMVGLEEDAVAVHVLEDDREPRVLVELPHQRGQGVGGRLGASGAEQQQEGDETEQGEDLAHHVASPGRMLVNW